jgi:tetratricopeptide (TPR) repeat protein
MNRLIRELRQRGVFRAAGLYIALIWLLLQIADVVFPAFEIPDSALRYILFGAIAGFPVAMLFSWFYEISSEGIRSEDEIRETGEQRSRGVVSGATIVLLALALGISLYANYEQASDAGPEAQPELVSILVSDFVNDTGDSIFDGSLEPALAIGMESAPFISAYKRHDAARIAEKISGSDQLDEESARLVSVREGIQLVLVGSIHMDGDGYEFSLRAIDPRDGEVVTDASTSADGKIEVLPAVGRLAIQMREGLGDATLEEDSESNETFTAASLEAARFYTIAQSYNRTEQNELAAEYYGKAVEEDPEFGRAYSGWALSARNLGRKQQAEELWEKTLTLLDTMTERERYRTLGSYYLTWSGNYLKAIESYQLLIDKYPADNAGRNNLAVAHFFVREFDKSLKQGGELVELFPRMPAYRANYALYAMYAGDFTAAREQANKLLEEEPGYYLGYVPLAIAELAEGKVTAAADVYQSMTEQGIQATSTAATGLADIALYTGEWQQALEVLRDGIETDLLNGNTQGAAHKGVHLAYALHRLGNEAAAMQALDSALETTSSVSHLMPAGVLLARMGELERAQEIRAQLDSRLQQNSRGAADVIAAEIALYQGDITEAVDAFNNAIVHDDSWPARFGLARAYAAAGYHAEALGELQIAEDRLGETSAVFMDDIPTFHYGAALPYWLGRTRQELGMLDTARDDYQRYLAPRVDTDLSEMSQDARARLEALRP